LGNMDTEGSTNIWDGLFKSMEELRNNGSHNRLGCVMLMTDGQPNQIPPRGHIPMLNRYFDTHPHFSCVVNTYGFGNSLDSSLLDDIAATTNGSYAFIPDSGFVGTIFVNSIANVLTTVATNTVVSLEFDPDRYEAVKEETDIHLTTDPSFVNLKVGTLSGDQERSFVFKLKNNDMGGDITASVTSWDLRTNMLLQCGEPVVAINSPLPQDFFRQALFDVVRTALKDGSNQANIDELRSLLAQYHDNDYVKGLIADLDGQITLGLSNEYIHKWGKHFLLSLSRAHLNQQCLNFKDPGVQFYGGALFKQIRDEADDAFNELPVPTPKKTTAGGSARSLSLPTRMTSYNYPDGGCFDGEGNVAMANGEFKKVKDLRKGDHVKSKYRILDNTIERFRTVACIVRTRIKDTVTMVDLDGTLLTPWHPVFHNDEWQFPAKIGEETQHQLDYIYNVVLDNGHSIYINQVECITLGHGLTHNDVVEHKYFGDGVVSDLKCSAGWTEGLVDVEEEDWTRGGDGRVNGLTGAFVL